MKKLYAACLALSLTPVAVAFGVDTDAVIGGAVGGGIGAAVGSEVSGKTGAIVGGAVGAAVGTAIMTDGNEEKSTMAPSRRVIHVEPAPAPPPPQVIYVEQSPPPQQVIYVREPRYRYVPPGHAKHWNKHKHKYKYKH